MSTTGPHTLKVGRPKSVLFLLGQLYQSIWWLRVGLRMDAKSHVSKRDWTMCSNSVNYYRFNGQMLLHLKPDCSLFFFSFLFCFTCRCSRHQNTHRSSYAPCWRGHLRPLGGWPSLKRAPYIHNDPFTQVPFRMWFHCKM